MNHRDLDALVAQARGWKRMRWCDWQKDARTSLTYSWHDETGKMTELAEDCYDYYNPTPAWSPSTDIAEAMALLDEWDGGWKIEGVGGYYGVKLWRGTELHTSHGGSLTEAICLAYLKAKGVEV